MALLIIAFIVIVVMVYFKMDGLGAHEENDGTAHELPVKSATTEHRDDSVYPHNLRARLGDS